MDGKGSLMRLKHGKLGIYKFEGKNWRMQSES
jgi:hypothetical protein